MTTRERNRLRRKQDKVISLARERGVSFDLPVSEQHREPTIRQLIEALWPEYEYIFDATITALKGQ